MSKDLISRVTDTKDPADATGAFVRGVRDKMHAIDSHLDKAHKQHISTLWDLLSAMEGHIALEEAQSRRRDFLAKQQQDAEAEGRQKVEDAIGQASAQ